MVLIGINRTAYDGVDAGRTHNQDAIDARISTIHKTIPAWMCIVEDAFYGVKVAVLEVAKFMVLQRVHRSSKLALMT